MLKSGLCDYSHAYILVTRTITVVGAGANAVAIAADRNNKQAKPKNFASFTDCITGINNTQVDDAKDLQIVMPMYNLEEYSHSIITQKHLKVYINFAKTSQIMLQQNLNPLYLNQNS